MNRPPDDLTEQVRRHTDLGHAARNDCFLRQVAFAVNSGGASLPKAAAQSVSPLNNLISLYRFLDNDAIPLSALRKIRAQVALDSVPLGADILVVHDVSPLDYSRHAAKNDRRPIGDHRGHGYEYVACLLVDPATSNVLGVIHDTVVSANGPDDQDTMDYDLDPTFHHFSLEEQKRLRENHRHQMVVHVHGLAPLLAGRHVIDVADREFDDIFLFDCCDRVDHDFVIRSSANRNVQIQQHDWIPPEALAPKQTGHPVQEGWTVVHLKRLLDAIPLRPYKSLPLDKRNRVTDRASSVRIARLSIGSCRIRLYRNAKRNGQYFRPPRPMNVNLVVIRETNPTDGVKPLLWVLFASLPVDTDEQTHRIGYLYELRWRIEQYFKLLKSGYRIEATHLDNATKIAKLLVLLSFAAMTIIALKADLDLPAVGRLSHHHYRRIKEAIKHIENPNLPLNLRLFALILQYGGWLARKTDPIGPTILIRGTLQLAATLHAIARYPSLIKEIQQNPHALGGLFRV